MNDSDKIKTISSKVEQNKAQFDLEKKKQTNKKTDKISALVPEMLVRPNIVSQI